MPCGASSLPFWLLLCVQAVAITYQAIASTVTAPCIGYSGSSGLGGSGSSRGMMRTSLHQPTARHGTTRHTSYLYLPI